MNHPSLGGTRKINPQLVIQYCGGSDVAKHDVSHIIVEIRDLTMRVVVSMVLRIIGC